MRRRFNEIIYAICMPPLSRDAATSIINVLPGCSFVSCSYTPDSFIPCSATITKFPWPTILAKS